MGRPLLGARVGPKLNLRMSVRAVADPYDCSLNDLGGYVMASAANSQQATTEVPVGTWTVDPVHSSVEFQVNNMGIVWVRGVFTDFNGSVESTGEPGGVRASGTVEAASLDTRSEQRDQHLRGPEFFDVENHPQITFESTTIETTADGLRVVGNLTIKGITREVELRATVQGTVDDPWGNQRVGVEATGTLNRRDFDLNWDVRTPGGAQLASDNVRLILHLGAVKSA
jgi:polyisoprenoid-binding protein YceI